MKPFPIEFHNKTVGSVSLQRQGMYYLAQCTCWELPAERCRIILVWDGNENDLGVCVPSDEGGSLVKRIPIKQLDGRIVSFHIRTADENSLFPIYENQPFDQIALIPRARLIYRHGGFYMAVQKESSSSNATGQ